MADTARGAARNSAAVLPFRDGRGQRKKGRGEAEAQTGKSL